MMHVLAKRLRKRIVSRTFAATAAVLSGVAVMSNTAPPAEADAVAYLINVHARPGYSFPNGDAAIAYGQTVCDRVAVKMPYAQLVDQVAIDFHSTDYYQAGYLINQAINELCPRHIWQLRELAAGYLAPA